MSPLRLLHDRVCTVDRAGAARYAPSRWPTTPPSRSRSCSTGGEIQLIDVRQAYEHEAGRIAGDRLIELMQLGARRPIRSIASGRSSSTAAAARRSAMATEAFRGPASTPTTWSGGLLEWQAAGLPLEPADGHVAEPEPRLTGTATPAMSRLERRHVIAVARTSASGGTTAESLAVLGASDAR